MSESKKKVGILTFHRAHNYGAVLQCYALQEVIRTLGYDVHVIDYRPEYVEQSYRPISFKRIQGETRFQLVKLFLREIVLLPIRCIRSRKFANFRNKITLSKTVRDSLIPANYDIYVVGSDQIWNKSITDGIDKIFFCDFAFPKNNRKYLSYAASTEALDFQPYDKAYFENALKKLDAISVREKEVMQLLTSIIEKPIEVVLDPTLLVPTSFWEKEVATEHIAKGDYVVLYQARYSKQLTSIAEDIAASMNCKLIEMTAWTFPITRVGNKGMLASPEEFLSYIKNAKLVINTSFHGTAFSLIFGVPFYYIALGDGWDSRVTSILSQLNLMDRVKTLKEISNIKSNELSYDFLAVTMKLEYLRKDSLSFLINNLG